MDVQITEDMFDILFVKNEVSNSLPEPESQLNQSGDNTFQSLMLQESWFELDI